MSDRYRRYKPSSVGILAVGAAMWVVIGLWMWIEFMQWTR